jgi:hypothetical protein
MTRSNEQLRGEGPHPARLYRGLHFYEVTEFDSDVEERRFQRRDDRFRIGALASAVP